MASYMRALVALTSLLVVGQAAAEDLVANALETVGTVGGGAQFVPTEMSPTTLVIADADDRVSVAHSDAISAVAGDYAMALWFRPTQGPTGQWRSVTYKGDAGNQRNFAIYLRPNDMRLHYRISTQDQWNDGGDSAQALLVGQWNHIAYVRRGNRLTLYINGRQDSADTLSGTPLINDGQLYLGDSPFNAPALGEMAEVNIYRRTLSPLEVRSLFEAKRPARNLEEQGAASGTPVFANETGRSGRVLRIDSDDDGVVLPNSVVLKPGTSNFSVAFWLRLDGGPTGRWESVLQKGQTDQDRTFSIWRRPDNNRLAFRISSSTTFNGGADTATELPVGAWTHVAYVKRGDQLQLFLNGSLDAQHTIAGNVVYNDDPLYLGRSPSYNPVRASYDDVSVFNYELRADDIDRLMAHAWDNPAQRGTWGPITPWPVVPVSMANLPDGRVLGFSGSERTTWPSTEQTYSAIWDPATGEFEDLFQPGHNMFCAHLAMTDQGEVFVNGGRNQVNSPWTTLFDYRDNRWQQIENMASGGRWYPVTNALPSGEIITSMGTASNLRNPEKWSRTNSWQVLNNVDYVDMRQTFDGTSGARRWWAILSVAPSGELFHYWNAQENHFIDTAGTGAVRPGNAVVDVDQPTGVAIQYDAGRMIMTGGNQGSRTAHGNNDRAYTIDLNGSAPVVQQTQAMRAGRTYHNLVPMPDGSVIALGGSRYSGAFNNLGAVYPAEIWDPQSGEWTLTAPAAVPRNYHSTALLLTDGRVLSAGGGYGSGNEFLNGSSHQNSQIFTPPYLYSADGTLADRPVISAAPGTVRAGQSFNVSASSDAQRFSMVRMGATTHAVNTDSRFLWLNTIDNGNGAFTLTPNANPNVVIPGYWMLFALDADGVPSEAHVVRVERGAGASTPGDLRYVKLVALSEVNGNPWTTVAELNVLDGNGARVDRTGWQVSADSEDAVSGFATRAIDGDPATIWHTDWRTNPGTANDPAHPHELVVDLGVGYALTGIDYLPRQDMPNGRIVDYRVEVSENGVDWTVVASASFPATTDEQRVLFGADLDNVTLAASDPSSAGTSATFTVSGAGNVEYTWAWGDGTSTSSTGDGSVAHDYDAPGRYTVVVTALDPVTGRDEIFEFIHIVYDAGIDIVNPDRWRSSTSIAFHPTRAQVWNVNPDHNTVTVMDAAARTRLAEIPVGDHPAGLAFDSDGNVWVTNKESGTLSVISAATLAGLREVELPNVNARPHGILSLGDTLVVALEGSNELARVDTSSNVVQSVAATVNGPRHLAIDPTRGELFVTAFITPQIPGESTSLPDPSQGVSAVEVRDAATLGVLATRSLPYSDVERTENTGPGIPNYLGSMAVHPAGGLAYLPSKQDNVLGGANRVGGPLTFDQAVRAVSLRLDLAGAATSEVLSSRLQHDNASVASAAVFGPWGVHMFTTLEGNRQIAMSLPDNDAEIARFNVGRAPQGLALSPDGTELVVHNFMDRTVQFIDIRDAVSGAALDVTTLATVDTTASEALAPDVLIGKQLFYDARDDRLAALDYMSCASCHEDGGHDGRVWDFTQFGEGVRNTTSLRGKAGTGHGLLHWTGNFDEVQDFEGQIREFAGGVGLMTDANFFAGTRAQPLGDPKAGFSSDLDALAAYLASLDQSDGRVRAGTGLSAAGERGASLFASRKCTACHADAALTDSDSGARHDIGTLTMDSGQRLGLALDGLDTPTLLGLATSAPYLHDGSAQTLQAAISAHSSASFTAGQLDELAAFLLEQPEAPSAPTAVLLQSGTVTIEQPNASTWFSVTFEQPFDDTPAVVMGPPTFRGGQATTMRVRNVTPTGFDYQLDEWDYLDGYHLTETIAWLAVLPGRHVLGGLEVEAMAVTATPAFRSLAYDSAFAATPVVLSQVVTVNQGNAVTTRQRAISATGLQLQLESEEGASGGHSPETVHVIAVSPGTGTLSDGSVLAAGITGDAYDERWNAVNFGVSLPGGHLLANMQTTDGGDAATLRQRALTATSVEMLVQEEQSANSEVAHTFEVLGWLVVQPAP